VKREKEGHPFHKKTKQNENLQSAQSYLDRPGAPDKNWSRRDFCALFLENEKNE
jgi:hypothetical protein